VLQREAGPAAGGALAGLDLLGSFCIKAKRTESLEKSNPCKKRHVILSILLIRKIRGPSRKKVEKINPVGTLASKDS
jgi:hypothetical protein